MGTIAQQTKSLSTKKSNGVVEVAPIAELPIIVNVWVDDARVHMDLEDGRSIAWPFVGSPILKKATPEQRQQFTYSAYHIFWDEIDEIIGIKNVLYPPIQVASA